MADTAILFAKPGAVRPSDKGALRKIGIVVVEVENLDDVRLVRPAEEASAQLPAGELLQAFAVALKSDDYNGKVKIAFANAVSAAITAKEPS